MVVPLLEKAMLDPQIRQIRQIRQILKIDLNRPRDQAGSFTLSVSTLPRCAAELGVGHNALTHSRRKRSPP
jgi:hypothetical protein